MKALIGTLALVANFCVNGLSQQSLLEYVNRAPAVNNFDGFSFVAENGSEYMLTKHLKPLVIDFNDTIPVSTFNHFVKTVLYPRRPQKLSPKIVIVKSENTTDSLILDDVGVLDFYGAIDAHRCSPKIVALAKRESKILLEFILLTDMREGVFIELYCYKKGENRILSYVQLFRSEKKVKQTCAPLGINLYSTYQTSEIKNEVINQLVNDSFSDVWIRRIRLNKSGYYEVVWNNNPRKKARIYEAVINDADGYTNVRKTPDLSSEVLFSIKKNEKFLVEDNLQLSNWFKVFDHNGNFEGWIYKSKVKITQPN
jgi:hypothetical protein